VGLASPAPRSQSQTKMDKFECIPGRELRFLLHGGKKRQ
jgi:hypothetical protein